MKKELALFGKFNKNTVLPVIDGNVLIKEGRITATDLTSSVSMPTSITGSGVVSLKDIKKITEKYPEASMSIEGDNLIATFKSKTFKFHASPSDDFPRIEKPTTKVGKISIDKEVKHLKSFLGKDALRPQLSCVYIDKDDLVATDAHTLRIVKGKASIDTSIIVPNMFFEMQDGEYEVYVEGLYGRFVQGDIEFTFRLLDGKYPNYKAVLPSEDMFTCHVEFPTEDFIEALDDCLVVATKGKETVKLDVDLLTISCENIDDAKEYSTYLPLIARQGDGMVIGFNALNMKTCLLGVGDIMTLDLCYPSKAITILSENTHTILMPVMLTK